MSRASAIVFALISVVLIATGETIYARPMDGLSVAWFVALGTVSAFATLATSYALFSRAQAGRMRDTFDGFFWAVFVIIPTSLGIFGIAAYTLAWWFLGLE